MSRRGRRKMSVYGSGHGCGACVSWRVVVLIRFMRVVVGVVVGVLFYCCVLSFVLGVFVPGKGGFVQGCWWRARDYSYLPDAR